MATITIPDTVPPPSEDAELLHKAFEGWGTDEKLIIKILAHRDANQRALIQQAYSQIYNEDLLKSLQKEVTSDFERILLLWAQSPAERDAYLANEATKKLTSNKWVLMEIACARSSHELFNVRQAYHSKYKKSLEEDVAYHTSGDYRKLLVPLITSFRYDGPEVNPTIARSEAKVLHAKIKEKAYTDEEVIRVLSTRSKAQLNATLNCYNNEFGNAINKDLKEGGDAEFLRLLRSVVKCLSYPQKYFEKVLRLSLNKMGTEEWDVSRVVATRVEVDMERIKEEFQRRNTLSLERAVGKDTGGDYERMVLALLGGSEF